MILIKVSMVQNCTSCLPDGNTFTVIKKLRQQEGIHKIFFSGVNSAIFSHLLRVGIFFPLRETLMSYFSKQFKDNEFIQIEMVKSMTSSFIARSVSTMIAFPIEVRKIDAQLNLKFTKEKTKTSHIIKRLIPTFLQFYQKEIFNTMFFWTIYELRKKYLKKKYQDMSETQLNIKCAVFSGTFSAFFSHPFDYFQTITNTFRKGNQPLKFSELMHHIRNNNGYLSILNGITFRTVRGGCINFIFFSLFENFKEYKLYK